MFDKLIDLAKDAYFEILPVFRVYDYERAILFTRGKASDRVYEPGDHLRIPFLQNYEKEDIREKTYTTTTQTVMTADGETVSISAVVTVKIVDVRAAILTKEDIDTTVVECTYGSLADMVRSETFEDLRAGRPHERLLGRCRRSANKNGVYVVDARFKDFAKVRALRLFNDYSEGS